MNSNDEYEYTQLLSAYRALRGAQSIMGNAGDFRANAAKRDSIVAGARASLRRLNAYQPTETEMRATDGANDTRILAWIRKSRPSWKFQAECEVANEAQATFDQAFEKEENRAN